MAIIIRFLKTSKAKKKTTLAPGATVKKDAEEAPPANPSRRNDSWNWSATSGQKIQGGLQRGEGGKFETANINAREAVAGLSVGDYDAANAFARGGRVDDATLQRLGEAGLLTRNARGQAVTSGASRMALLDRRASAVQIDKERADRKRSEAESLADQKKKENEKKQLDARDVAEKKAEEKATKTARERQEAKVRAAEEKDAAQAKALQQQAKAAKAAEEQKRQLFADTSLAAGLPAEQLAALMDFIKGTDVAFKSPMGNALEKLGLLSAIAGENTYTIGSTANAFLNATMSGNIRAAKDILTMARKNRRDAEQQAADAAAQMAQAPTVQQGGEELMTGRSAVPPRTFTPTLIKKRTKQLSWNSPVLFKNKRHSQTIVLFPRENPPSVDEMY